MRLENGVRADARALHVSWLRRARAHASARPPSSAPQTAPRAAFHAAALFRQDIIGIDLGTTNSCVAIMEVRQRAPLLWPPVCASREFAGAKGELPGGARCVLSVHVEFFTSPAVFAQQQRQHRFPALPPITTLPCARTTLFLLARALAGQERARD